MTQKNTLEAVTSISLFCEDEARATAENRAYICIGSPRGGTSMVAGAMAGLGIFMGDDLPVNVEDPLFNPDNQRDQMDSFIRDAAESVRMRQRAGKVWGWKYPQAVEYLPDIKQAIDFPNLVIVYRDPIPACVRAVNGAAPGTSGKVLSEEFYKSISLSQRNFELAQQWKVPTLLVSYEKASLFPELFVRELSEFCGLAMPQDITRIIDFMAPGQYKRPPV